MSRLAPFARLLLFVLAAPFVLAQNQSSPASNSPQEVPKGDWVTYDRDYLGDRYSPLDEIKTDNVTGLQEICTYDSGVRTSFETGPVVADGTLYFTTLDTRCQSNW